MSQDNADLEARLEEQEAFEPPESFVEQANVTDQGIYEEFEENWPESWERAADLLSWDEEYDTVLEDGNAPFYEWFTGGELNASYNCLDRHIEEGRATASPSSGRVNSARRARTPTTNCSTRSRTSRRRCETSASREDDIVTLYMPMVPELPIAMLACARIGAPHSVVFAGFSADALATRMNSADSEYLVTCDGYYRRGDALDHISKTNEGLSRASNTRSPTSWSSTDSVTTSITTSRTTSTTTTRSWPTTRGRRSSRSRATPRTCCS